MKKIFNNLVVRIVSISLLTTVLGGSIVYGMVKNEYGTKMTNLEKELISVKEENKKLSIEKEELEKLMPVEQEENKDEQKEVISETNDSNNDSEQKSEPSDSMNEVIEVMKEVNKELDRVYNKITNTGTFSGLQDTFDTLYEYGLMLDDLSNTVDVSSYGDVGIEEAIKMIAMNLKSISDGDMAGIALETMGSIAEFVTYIEMDY